MKYTPYYLIIILLFCLTNCTVKENDRSKDNMKGKIESFVEFKSYVLIDSGKLDLEKKVEFMATKVGYNTDGNYEYYAFFDILEDSIQLGAKTLFKYENNKVIQRDYNGEEQLINTNIFTKDNKGNIIHMLSERPDDHTKDSESFVYYSNNRLDSTVTITNGNKRTERREYLDKYGSFKNIVTDQSGLKSESFYYKDEKGRTCKTTVDNQTTVYEYNEHNDLITHKSDESLITYQYKYDKTGNWIERIMHKEIKNDTIFNKWAELSEREFKYLED